MFGPDEIAPWSQALDAKPMPVGDDEWFNFPQIDAFSLHALNCGMVLRLAARDGRTFDFTINPVAARHLAACILTMGQQAGWLSESADVVCPQQPLNS